MINLRERGTYLHDSNKKGSNAALPKVASVLVERYLLPLERLRRRAVDDSPSLVNVEA